MQALIYSENSNFFKLSFMSNVLNRFNNIWSVWYTGSWYYYTNTEIIGPILFSPLSCVGVSGLKLSLFKQNCVLVISEWSKLLASVKGLKLHEAKNNPVYSSLIIYCRLRFVGNMIPILIMGSQEEFILRKKFTIFFSQLYNKPTTSGIIYVWKHNTVHYCIA